MIIDSARKALYIGSCLAKGLLVVLVGFVIFVFLTTTWNDEQIESFLNDGFGDDNATRWHNRHGSEAPGTPITLSCPTAAVQPACRSPVPFAPASAPSPSSFSRAVTPSCPDYFRYIHEDLKPWSATGITKEMVESARQHANVNFRLAIIQGRAYLYRYSKAFQTRDVFTIWGILQLLNRYPGRVPDLEIMFNCDDPPAIKADSAPPPPPPLFRYCKDATTFDIVFPDWSFWGWPEVNLKPWEKFQEEIWNESRRLEWKDREPYAYWRGNPGVAWTRGDLMRCNVSNGKEWNARLFSQDWDKELRTGFQESSNMAKQCTYRYKIYIEGRSWSVSEKYILACNSPMLLVTTPFIDFFTRGLMPGQHYWPIRTNQKCKSIKYAVEWGNRHQREAQKMGKRGSHFTQEELSMENVYDYMLHLLTEYAKLLRYKPTIPEKATEICMESLACSETGLVKQFLLDSMVKSTYDVEPCLLPPPFKIEELDAIARSKDENIKKVEVSEDRWKP